MLGADWRVEPRVIALRPAENFSAWVKAGKFSMVDVTRTDFSTARRYFPMEL